MISVNSILVTAVFVFSVMLVGIALTAMEFKALREERASKPVSGDEAQDSYHQRHSVQLVAGNDNTREMHDNGRDSRSAHADNRLGMH